MKSYEAIQKAINGKTIEHAKTLGKSISLLAKWQEPALDYTDSGAYNPLDRIEAIVETALKLGEPKESALAPIQYLAEKFSLVMISLPKQHAGNIEISRELLKTIKEFGEMAEAASRALDNDGRVDKREAQKIDKEAWDLIRQTALFVEAIKGSAR